MTLRRSSTIAVLLSGLTLSGCSILDKLRTGQVDAGHDAGVVVATVHAAAALAPPVTPENLNQVGRFPDEVALNDAEAKIADPVITARNSVPGGAFVATLRLGTPVTQIAKHESFILCEFSDPKNGARKLVGWIAEQAFVPGATVPRKLACGAGKTHLTFDEQDFCGKTCKTDAECEPTQACIGKANLVANGKPGAEVSTCTPPPGVGLDGGAGKVVVDGGKGAPAAGGRDGGSR